MTTISQIDKQIDAISDELKRRVRIKVGCPESWHAAWNKYPELRDQQRELYRQRGVLQLERDEKSVRPWSVPKAHPRKKCPTCGQRTLAA